MAGSLPGPRKFVVRALTDPSSGDLFDRAVVFWLPAPRSFTGEDCAEIHLHGSRGVLGAVTAFLASHNGVRAAEAGEFTKRAFVNGKLDLVEVEGLGDLLEANTASQRRQALRQMSGHASSVFEDWRRQLLVARAGIEAAVDFADEPGVAEEALRQIDGDLTSLVTQMHAAVLKAATAEVIRDGARVVLAGHPNTGKSSLLNALAARDVAIVSNVPGTTRDAIEVSLDLNGQAVVLTDTAGLRRDSGDSVELEGIRRSRSHMATADVLVWVWSADVPGSEDPGDCQPDISVRGKSDQGQGAVCHHPGIARNFDVSARSGEGIANLIRALEGLITDRFGDVESILVVSVRQQSVLKQAILHLDQALSEDGSHIELKAESLRRAADEIGRLVGRIDVEEWLGVIFSRFCIGK